MDATDKRMLDHAAARFVAHAGQLKEAMQTVQAIQQKMAAYASLLTAHGMPIPQVEGVMVQNIPMSPAQQQALLQAIQQTSPNSPIEIPPAQVQPALQVGPAGTVRAAVKEVFKDHQALTVRALRDEIFKKYGVRFALSSIYRILMQDYRKGDDMKWRAK